VNKIEELEVLTIMACFQIHLFANGYVNVSKNIADAIVRDSMLIITLSMESIFETVPRPLTRTTHSLFMVGQGPVTSSLTERYVSAAKLSFSLDNDPPVIQKAAPIESRF
jgi:hypothetical protein